MGSFSNITIFGHLGRKPTEPKVTPSGSPVTDFSIAVSSNRGKEENTTWYVVKVFGKQVQSVYDYLDKGSPAIVTGRHQLREYTDRDGNTRMANEVFASDVTFVGGRDQAASASAGSAASTTDPILDDDVPF
jgi:single-strand DNA-binding protein